MSNKLTAIKIKYPNGTYSEQILLSVLAENVQVNSTTTLSDALNLMDARIDQLVAPTGSTSALDAEIFDARIGVDSTNHGNLGDAIRNQINSLKTSTDNEISDLKNAVYQNLIGNNTSVLYPAYIKAGSSLTISTSDGSVFPTTSTLQLLLFNENKSQIDYFALKNGFASRTIVTSTKKGDVYYLKWNEKPSVPLMVNYGRSVLPYKEYTIPYSEQITINKNKIDNKILNGEYVGTTTYSMEQGGLRTNNGGNSDSSTYIRTANYTRIDTKSRIRCDDDHLIFVCVYTATTYTKYVGWIDSDGSLKTSSQATWSNDVSFADIDKNYYYRVCVKTKDLDDITPTSTYNIYTYAGTNTDFTKKGIPADSQAVGNELSKLFPLSFDKEIRLSSGIDLNNITTPGRYYTDSIALSESIINTPANAAFSLLVMSTTSEARLYQIAFINYGVTGNTEKLHTGIRVRRKKDPEADADWSDWLTIGSNETTTAFYPTHIRVMQYNIGKFRWGYVNGLEKYGLTEEQYKEKLLNYKRFFAKYQPDVLGLQECVLYMDKAQTHETKEVLFNPIYRYVASNNYYNDKLVESEICANLSAIDGQRYSIQDLTGTVKTWFKLVTIQLGGKRIRVASGALSSSGTPQQRAEQLEYLITNKLENFDYAIILSDLNSGYRQDEETGELIDIGSLSTVLNKAAEYGFKAAQGMNEYWGATVTYVHHEGVDVENYYSCLDNILVKGDIKIKNFEVLTNEYENLASDHIPVIADLYIY